MSIKYSTSASNEIGCFFCIHIAIHAKRRTAEKSKQFHASVFNFIWFDAEWCELFWFKKSSDQSEIKSNSIKSNDDNNNNAVLCIEFFNLAVCPICMIIWYFVTSTYKLCQKQKTQWMQQQQQKMQMYSLFPVYVRRLEHFRWAKQRTGTFD